MPRRTKNDASSSPPILVKKASKTLLDPTTPPPLLVKKSAVDQRICKPRQIQIENLQTAAAPSPVPIDQFQTENIAQANVQVVLKPIQPPIIAEQRPIVQERVENIDHADVQVVLKPIQPPIIAEQRPIVQERVEYNVDNATNPSAIAVQEIIKEFDAIPMPVVRSADVKKKSNKVKVDSGQQTTPKLQRSTSTVVPDAAPVEKKAEEPKTTAFK